MTLADDLRRSASEADSLIASLADARTQLAAALNQGIADEQTIVGLQGQVASLTLALADCQGGPPPAGYLFGVNNSPPGVDFTNFVTALKPGTIDVERIYYQQDSPPFALVDKATAAGHQSAFSFKPSAASYAEVSGGARDSYIRTVGTALGAVVGLGGVFHEAENPSKSGMGTSTQFRTAWEHAHAILKPLTPKMRWGPILMSWTFNPSSGRNPRDWIPNGIDFLGVDGYSDVGKYLDPAALFGRVADLAETLDVPWGIFECNAPNTEPRKAEWITATAKVAKDRGAICLISYDKVFGTIDYRSAANPSWMSAWKGAAA